MNIDMNNENTKNEHVRKVIFTGVMAALSYGKRINTGRIE